MERTSANAMDPCLPSSGSLILPTPHGVRKKEKKTQVVSPAPEPAWKCPKAPESCWGTKHRTSPQLLQLAVWIPVLWEASHLPSRCRACNPKPAITTNGLADHTPQHNKTLTKQRVKDSQIRNSLTHAGKNLRPTKMDPEYRAILGLWKLPQDD